MKYTIYDIVPVSKPRMTNGTKYNPPPVVTQYWAFKDQVALEKVDVPNSGFHAIFIVPMPTSWTEKEKAGMNMLQHLQTPDVDNMAKALLDSLFKDDSHIWDCRISKFWGYEGKIIIITGIETDWMFEFLKEVL